MFGQEINILYYTSYFYFKAKIKLDTLVMFVDRVINTKNFNTKPFYANTNKQVLLTMLYCNIWWMIAQTYYSNIQQ